MDDAKQKTFSQRSKEDAHVYRYFPEPDIPPVVIDQDTVDSFKTAMPVMPGVLRGYMREVGVDRMSVEAILDYPELAWRWNEIRVHGTPTKVLKKIADWFANDVLTQLAENPDVDLTRLMKDSDTCLNAHELVRLAKMVEDSMLSSTAAKSIITSHWTDLYNVEAIAKEKDLLQVSDSGELEKIVEQIISENQKAAEDIRNGEMKAIGFMVGQVMKASMGKANPSVVQGLIKDMLSK